MTIDKESWTDLGNVVGNGIDTIQYAFTATEDLVAPDSGSSVWSTEPPMPKDDKQRYLWMYIRMVLTNSDIYRSTPAVVGIVPALID